jgi:hypothetical protein
VTRKPVNNSAKKATIKKTRRWEREERAIGSLFLVKTYENHLARGKVESG